jgi:hypothetical protein
MTRTLCAALALCLLPMAAFAQAGGAALDLGAAEQLSQGPMTVERIHNGFLAAPDFKITDFDRKASGLVGGYAGVVFAEALFLGGGGYGLVTDTRGRGLAYGGLIMQWFGRTNEPFGYSARMLVGAGTADSTQTVQLMDRGRGTTQALRVKQDFVVFEPEVNALMRFSKQLRLTVGAGYRFTGNGWYDRYGYNDGYPGRVNPSGATGSIGLQIGGGS